MSIIFMAAQIANLLAFVLFSMGAIADKELDNRKLYGTIAVANMFSFIVIFYINGVFYQ